LICLRVHKLLLLLLVNFIPVSPQLLLVSAHDLIFIPTRIWQVT
jgi:hypothetical protein